jgi:hypothetical protein
MHSVLGLLVVVAIAVVLFGVILQARLSPKVKSLLLVGLVLRVAGSQIYYYLSQWIYGFGDYSNYYGIGLEWGEAWATDTLESFRSPYVTEWCCTGFTVRLTGLLLRLLGPTINGAFITYAVFGYIGIIAIAASFARAYPKIPLERYLVWVILFPSLWYWPAALGKDALMLGGIGLAVLGFTGKRGRPGWVPLALGMALVFAVRPQVAVVVAFSMVLAYWMGSDTRWTAAKFLQGGVLAIGGLVLLNLASGALGLQLFSPDEVEAYLDTRSSASGYGGSVVQGGVISGTINVLFRPFPWDVRGIASAIAAVEVMSLWGLAIWNRANISAFFRANRKTRFLWFGITFISMYVLLTGMALGNLGLIARQRVLIYPFLLMFFAGRPTVQSSAPVEPDDELEHHPLESEPIPA